MIGKKFRRKTFLKNRCVQHRVIVECERLSSATHMHRFGGPSTQVNGDNLIAPTRVAATAKKRQTHNERLGQHNRCQGCPVQDTPPSVNRLLDQSKPTPVRGRGDPQPIKFQRTALAGWILSHRPVIQRTFATKPAAGGFFLNYRTELPDRTANISEAVSSMLQRCPVARGVLPELSNSWTNSAAGQKQYGLRYRAISNANPFRYSVSGIAGITG